MKSTHLLCLSLTLIFVLNADALAEGAYEISVVNGDVVINNFSKKLHEANTIAGRRPPNKAIKIQNDYVFNYYDEQPYIIYSPQTTYNNASCWYQLDPYTFLGDIFGYDYDYFCR